MSTCKDHADIVLSSYKCIQTAGITTDLVRPLLSSMRACSSSKAVQKEGCVLLSKMSSDKVSNKLGELGAIQDIISILRSNMNGLYDMRVVGKNRSVGKNRLKLGKPKSVEEILVLLERSAI